MLQNRNIYFPIILVVCQVLQYIVFIKVSDSPPAQQPLTDQLLDLYKNHQAICPECPTATSCPLCECPMCDNCPTPEPVICPVCTPSLCPTCPSQAPDCKSELCLIDEPLPVNQKVYFKSLIDKRNTLGISLVNYDYRNLTANWLCYAKKLDYKNYLFLAEDQKMYDWLTNRNEPVILLENKHANQFNYYQREYHEIMNSRTKFVLKLLTANIGVLIFDVDAVWLSDPFPYIYEDFGNFDIVGQNDKDMYVNETQLCGGFLYIKSNRVTIDFWTEVSARHDAMLRSNKRSGLNWIITEQEYIDQLLNKEKNFIDLRWRALPADKFPSGLNYFFKKLPIPDPVVLHANYNPHGTSGKEANFKDNGFWKVDEDNNCK